MDVTPLITKDRQLITGYGQGGFVINGMRHDGSILLFEDHVESWLALRMADVEPDIIGRIAAHPVDLLLIGAGSFAAVLDPAMRVAFKTRGIGVEVMDTGAACRTYNVLLSEERRVAAALIAV